VPDNFKSTSALHGDAPAAAATTAWADRKELASAAFERTRMPIVITDARQPDNPIVLANKAFLDLTGYTSDEVLGRNCRFLQGEGTSPAAVAEIRAAIERERETNVEILNFRKDGSPFWNQLHLSPIKDDEGGLLYYFASQIDVTKHRMIQTLEAAEHRLLMEVDHRAKNVLAVVDGIVRLSKTDSAPLYAAAVQRRVQALAVAHALLAERGWRDVPLDEIVSRQVAHFASGRTAMSGPEVLIPAVVVQPLALVAHELIVNAATHGALAQDTGRLQVSWQATGHHGGFNLRWEESGRRKAGSPPGAPGFGTTMVNAIVQKQLQGEILRDWTSDGLKINISIPGTAALSTAKGA